MDCEAPSAERLGGVPLSIMPTAVVGEKSVAHPRVYGVKTVEAVLHLDQHVIHAPISFVASAVFKCNFERRLTMLEILLPAGAAYLLRRWLIPVVLAAICWIAAK
eukprot:CAMPEP_0185827490 /NCGR_PEP_ID=MMETSP1322-20130828/32077_1 /TAXON_ID=265543 /ORGANISM="Minutocellus polymorphus, Strain RCC2270" /LENGTH=104 /DNA_ID=CAMNT_0028525225 /DNA_START=825 /DNA_END=1139 /DNA_ORIENTATION=-